MRRRVSSQASRFLQTQLPIFQTAAPQTRGYALKPAITSESIPAELQGINNKVLQDSELRSLVDNEEVWQHFLRIRETGERMPEAEANYMAAVVRQWAQKKGCSCYAHWFSPIRGVTHGEKIETFIDQKDGKLIVNLSHGELFQTETDGSSFPNGGLRDTHCAAAFMGWDTFSSPFIVDGTLMIPSSFISWTGEALDQKTPLLRANDAVNKQSIRLLRHLGDKKAKKVVSSVGWEQEFFVITRDAYLQRPDLIAAGRTLMGAKPFRGQQASQNYFAKIEPAVKDLIIEAKDRMWELGISIDCMHNEVAPAQHEMSPIFSLASEAVTQNILAMEIMHDIAYQKDLKVIFHEKPFAGINGTGKHTNWDLSTDTGRNLFVPGKTDEERRYFVAFIAALARAVNVHGDVMRIGVSTSGNDHRLGAQEAPPAIFTLMMGQGMEQYFKNIANGADNASGLGEKKLIKVVPGVADIKAAAEDRNRTAPFPFCGNRFEFRAVGGNQHVAFPTALLTTAMADSIAHICDRVEAGKSVDTVIKEVLKENIHILYSENNYDPKLVKYAKDNGIFHLKSSPEAYHEFTSQKNINLFSSMGVFTEKELFARKNILYDQFATDLAIEARTMLSMVKTGIAPAVFRDLNDCSGFDSSWLSHKRGLNEELLKRTDTLAEAFKSSPSGTPQEEANYALDSLRTAMDSVREITDELENEIAGDYWPFPTYNEILHGHH